MVNLQKYIFIKLCCGIHSVNSCYLSGFTLTELYCIFGSPSRLALSYNDFDNLQIVDTEEFEEYTKDRLKYYDIVCADIKENLGLSDLNQCDTLNNFIKYNTPVPVIWLPYEVKSFCIYSHDNSLYSYLCFRIPERLFVFRLLERIFGKTSKGLNVTVSYNLIMYFFELFKNGVVIDTESIQIRDNHLKLKISLFHEKDNFSNMIYSPESLMFEDISIII